MPVTGDAAMFMAARYPCRLRSHLDVAALCHPYSAEQVENLRPGGRHGVGSGTESGDGFSIGGGAGVGFGCRSGRAGVVVGVSVGSSVAA